MKLSSDIKNKFEDIDGKIDFVIELCQTLQQENSELTLKIKDLEAQIEQNVETEKSFSEKEEFIQSKVDILLEKLNHFSNDLESVESTA